MVDDDESFRMKAGRVALTVIALTLASLCGPAVHAQGFRPNINVNVEGRLPSIAVAPRISPNVAGAATSVGRTTPNLKTYQGCSYAERDSDGECSNKTGSSADGRIGVLARAATPSRPC